MGRLEDLGGLAALVEVPDSAREGIEAVQGTSGTPVDRLTSMSPNARWGLKQAGIFALEAAAALSDEELLAIPRFGESSLVKLREWQANPSAVQQAAGRFQSGAREQQIFTVYAALRSGGTPAAIARELAVDEVDALAAHLKGGAA